MVGASNHRRRPRKTLFGAQGLTIPESPTFRYVEYVKVLRRWFDGNRKYTRLLTVNVDGSGMYNLSDDDMVSHCYWKKDEEIIAFENKHREGYGYYLMRDRSREYRRLWKHIGNDGHPSYSPDGKLVLTDTYPDHRRIARIKILMEIST